MRTAHKVLAGAICVCALPYAGYRIHALIAPAPVPLACPDLSPIPETRWAQVSEPTQAQMSTWPIPPDAAPLVAPRRAVQRKRAQSPLGAPPAEQCAFPPSGAPGLVPNGELHLVPEPSSLSLVAVALVGVGVLRRAKATT